jgi:pimeloyl-ACP methyl ester carboxylesterase
MNGAASAAMSGACLSVVGMAAYLRDIRRGATVPHRGSWLVWSIVAVAGAVAQGAHGVSWTLLVLGVQAATSIAVLALAVRRGVGGVTVGNAALIGVAGGGIVAWIMAADPLAATAGAVLADGAGLAAIVPKLFLSGRSPRPPPPTPWPAPRDSRPSRRSPARTTCCCCFPRTSASRTPRSPC